MLINQIIGVTESDDSGVVEEPVTLQEVKDYLRLGGFDSDDSGEQDISFDDLLIQSQITEGRMWLEKFTNQYIVPRSLTVVLLNQAGGIVLPGPVSGVVTIVNESGQQFQTTDKEVSLYLKVSGGLFRKIYTSYGDCAEDQLTATYAVGYTNFPEWVRNSILAYVADHYEFRGDDKAPAPNERAGQIARPYRREGAWG